DDIDIAEVGPEERRGDHRGEDHQPAHGRRAGLLEMGLRAVGADRLALALADAEGVDDLRPEEENEERGSEQRCASPEGDVAEQIEYLEMVRQLHQPQQHLFYPLLSPDPVQWPVSIFP